MLQLKAQDGTCDPDGEPYAPIPVDAVLGNPQVLLRQVGNANPVMSRGPDGADLHGLGGGFYLDFPGDALTPGCLYEQDGRRFTTGLEPTVYAHVIEDVGDGQLVLQYWFYWYYNDWNNKHESDWEGIALLFDVPTAEAALATDPVQVGYSQHEGGEAADWDAAKLDREGDHPVVYSSVGSHASYFGAALYLGRGASEGFGCDNTDGPHRRVAPDVVLLPDAASGAADPFAWLEFEGRWGERQSGPFNGPTGPTLKERWHDPLPWFEQLRDSSVVVPGGDRTGDGVVRTFCAVVEGGSGLLLSFTASPTTTLLGLAAVAVPVLYALSRTRWDRVAPLPVRSRRRFGQIVRAAIELYRRHPLTFALVGAVYAPVAALAALAAAVVGALPLLGSMLDVAGRSSGTAVVLALSAGSIPNLVAYLVVNALVAELAARLDAGERPVLGDALRQVWARRAVLASGFVRALVIVVGLLVSVVGIPWALRQVVRYQFLAQEAMTGDVDGAAALRRSSERVRGRWLHTALAAGSLQALVLGGGTVVGLLVLVTLSSLPLWAFSALVALVSAALVPLGAIGVTLLHGDAVAEAAERRQGEDGDGDGDEQDGTGPEGMVSGPARV
ncbi:MAG: Vps62-related protein [Acidimicrobiales bacterium]